MPNSLKCKIKHLCHNGTITERERDRILKALEQEPILDKIKAEFISLYPKNYAGEPEFGGLSCVFSLDKLLEIIDKYRVESEDKG